MLSPIFSVKSEEEDDDSDKSQYGKSLITYFDLIISDFW